jgi:hypothetical protein
MKKRFVSLLATYFRAVIPLLRGNPARARMSGAAVNKAIVAILAGGVALSLVAFAVVKVWAACEPPGSPVPTEPYLCTERDNYNPGEMTEITGVAFQPGETVELIVLFADGTPATGEGHEPWQVVADADGNFQTTWHVCEDGCVEDSVLVLTATGLSSALSAQAFFTDATTTERSLPCTGLSENFNGMGSNAVVFIPSGFVVDSTAGTARNPNPPIYNDATNAVNTTQSAGTTGAGALTSTSTGGIYNFGNGTNATATNRALGVLNSGSFGTPRSIMFGVTNATATIIPSITISWNYEKYRSGSRAHNWTFFSSTDGTNWTAQTAGDQSYAADTNNTVVFNPPQQIAKTVTIMGANIPANGKIYFRWTLTGVGGTPSSDTNGQGLGIDDVAVTSGTGTPTATCQNITRSLGSTSPGTVTVNATEINNGSSGGCGTPSFGIRKGTSGTFSSSVSFACSETGANTVELQVTNQAGDSATCTATVTVQDTTAPVVTCPANQTAECNNGSGGATVNYAAATATDNCDTVTPTCNPASGSTFAKGTTTVTCTASDTSGNTGSCQFTVTVRDTTAPVVTCPANQTAECNNGSGGAVVNYPAATAIDACEGAKTAICTPPSGATFAKGATTVTCTASDTSGNTGSCQFTVTVRDTTAPAFNNCPSTTILSNAVLAADYFEDGSRLKTGGTDFNWFRANSLGSGVRPQLNIITDTILGGAGNKALQLGASSEALEPALGANGFNPTTLVAVGDSIELTLDFHLTNTNRDSASGVRIGLYNSNGTPVTADQTQQSNDDFGYYISIPTGPTNRLLRLNKEIGGGPGFEVGGNAGSGDVSAETAASIRVGNSNISDNATKYTFRLTITKTATGVQVVGRVNGGAIASSITYNDGSNPFVSFDEVMINESDGQDYVIDNVMVLVPVECNSGGAVVTYPTPTATDACEGAETVTCTPASGSTFPVGNNTVTCTAGDSSGNTGTCSFTVTVPDKTAPVVTCPGAITKSNDPNQCSAVVTYNASASDACEAALTPTCNPPSGSTFPVGTTTVTCTASDSSGNTGTCGFTVTVKDTQAPSLSCPSNKTVECPGDTSPTATGQATATDNCGSATVTSSDSIVAGCGNTKTITRTWTATDPSGNNTNCTQTITVVDTTAPVLSGVPADTTVECNAVPAAATVTASDNCDGSVAVSFSQTSTQTASGCGQFNYTITRTWSAHDACNNSSSQSQTITVHDTTAPVLSGQGADTTVECPAMPSFTAPTASDNCDASPTISFSDVTTPGSCPQDYSVTRTWTATDACGNTSASVSQTITVVDTTQPVLNGVPANATVECDAVPAAANVTATDSCDPSPTVSFQQTRTDGNCPNNYSLTRTWTATDACNNSATATQTITVHDTTAPVISCPAEVTTNTDAGQCYASGVALGSPTTSDNCGGTVTVVNNAPSQFATGTNLVLWTATDSCGNSSTCTQKVIVVDNQAPVLSGCPAPMASFQCYSQVPAAATVTASDNCNGSVTVSVSESQSNPGSICSNTITRTWTATDASGNTASCTQTIVVNDTTPPTLTCPSDKQLACGASTDPSNTGTATATDNCGGLIKMSYADTATSSNCAGQAVDRVWTATDDCGNSATCTQHITFVNTQPPQISCPADKTVECSAPKVPSATGMATASVACGAPAVVTYSDSVTPGSCPNNYTITRAWAAADSCGNSATCVQTITVRDTTPPTMTCPASVTQPAGSGQCSAAVNYATPTASDSCGTASVVCAPPSGSTFQKGTNTVMCTATDACGNTSACSFTVTVTDTQNPTITCPSNIVTNTAPGQCQSAALTYAPTASDNCPGVTTSCTPPSGSTFAKGTNTVACTATDASGNTANCSFSVTVVDTTPPTITCPPNTTVAVLPAPNPGSVTASDNCGTPTVSFVSDSAVTNGCQVVVTRTYKATDASGNSRTCTQTITVQPTISPTDCILWHAPLANSPASDDTDPSRMNGQVSGTQYKYPFKAGSTIPIQIRINGCTTADVTTNPNLMAVVHVYADVNCDNLPDGIPLPIDYNGIGDPGGVMDTVGGFKKYNLDTKTLPTTGCFIIEIVLTDTSTGQSCMERVLLQRK